LDLSHGGKGKTSDTASRQYLLTPALLAGAKLHAATCINKTGYLEAQTNNKLLLLYILY
jgi:hypothetical protein